MRRGYLASDGLAVATVFLVSIAYRLPPLINAAGTTSDAAVVGLQATHILRREWAWFLWGSGYQTSVDSVVAAMAFLLGGPTPLALMLSTLAGHLVLVLLAYAVLRRRFAPWSAALLVSPLVLTPGPLHTYILSPPRQASLTLLFAGIWLVDTAPGTKRAAGCLALGSFVVGLACFADPYCLLLLPAVALFVVLTARDGDPRTRTRRIAAGVLGGTFGLGPAWLLAHSSGASGGAYTLTPGLIGHNLRLLLDECLPFLLSTKVFLWQGVGEYAVWQAPLWFRAVQFVGAGLLVVAIVAGGVAATLLRGVPPESRRLGILGSLMLPVTLGGFLLSAMVMDFFSARYLAAILLVTPFALAPIMQLVGPKRLGLALLPYLVSAGVAGWLRYDTDVSGWHLRHENGAARDEKALGAALRSRGVHYGVADYWVSYRLTFLLHEDPVIVPWHQSQDRYPPYRAAFVAAPVVAYVYDPWRSHEDLTAREARIRSGESEFEPVFENFTVGRYTVLVLRRLAPSAAAFYHHFGFTPFPANPHHLFLPMVAIAR
jgi:hypothetical protein